MPAPAQPRPAPAAPPPALVQHVGNQEDFKEAGEKIAATLGWYGAPTDEANEIQVQDAQVFLTKTLHEHFQAGALGKPQPAAQVAVDHLGLLDADEIEELLLALGEAYTEGKKTPHVALPPAGEPSNINAALVMGAKNGG